MNETIREKAIRFIVILLCAFAVSIGFQMHSNAKNVTFETKAVPVHLSQNDSDSPVLAVYRYMENKHLLILYEIDRMNNHFFHAIHTIELNTDAKALAPDKETKGIWVELDGKWHYYNEQLKIEDRSIQYKIIHSHHIRIVMIKLSNYYLLISAGILLNSQLSHSINLPVFIH